jgi:hypothetical protein
MGERFVDSATWRDLTGRPAAFVATTVIRELKSGDIDDLLQVFATGSAPERLAAIGILRVLAQRWKEIPEVPWTDNARAALAEAVAAKTRDYFEGRLPWTDTPGSFTRVLWLVLDPEGYLAFLLPQALERMATPMQDEALRCLASLARDHAIAREKLEATAAAHEELAPRVRAALEFVGIVTQERIDYWSRRWRDSKDPEALDWLYDKWLSFLPVGYPVDRLLEVLGPPQEGELPDIYYASGGGHVYVEAYETTGFSGCHRT